MSFSDVSAVTNHFSKAREGFTTTTTGTVTSGATIVGLVSVSGLTTGDVFVGVIEPGLTKEQIFTGIVDVGGSQITGVKWVKGTNVDHAGGVVVVDYDVGAAHNMMTKGMLVAHDQDGTLKAGAVDNSAVITDGVVSTAKLADGAVTAAKIGDNAVTSDKMLNGMVKDRQGTTSGDGSWQGSGTTNTDTSAKDVFMQAGAQTGSAGGAQAVTFPTAYNQIPNVQATVVLAGGVLIVNIDSVSTTGFTFSTYSTASARALGPINWLAIGQ